MEGEEVTSNDLVDFVSGQILTAEGLDIFDAIFDWIADAVSSIVSSVTGFIDRAVDWIVSGVTTAVNWIVSGIKSAVDWVKSRVGSIWDWVVDTYHKVSDWVRGAYDTVRSATLSVIDRVRSWIESGTSAVRSWVSDQVNQMLPWFQTAISNLSSSISAWFSETWTNISALFSTWGENIGEWWNNLTVTIASFFTDLGLKLEAGWGTLETWMTNNIVSPMGLWWDDFIARILNFGAWAGTLLDSVWGWFTEDVPGSSPRGEGIIASIWEWIYRFFTRPPEIAEAPLSQQMYYSLNKLVGWMGDLFNAVFTTFMEAVDGFVTALGPTNPDIATDNYRSLSSVGMTALAGLAGMTMAGSWLKPLGGAGMGQIAAMIYDMTNYKVITGAAITALTVAAIRTPLTYHFNELFRPWLLSPMDFRQLMSRQAFRDPEALQNPELVTSVGVMTGGDGLAYENRMIGYQGYPAAYYGFFKELANTPLRYFPLAGIARTGFFEKTWFTEALHRSGYSKTAIDALMVMYEKMVDEAVQGTMSGAAVKRFKEGLTTEDQFYGEMTLLGYSDQQFPKYLAAAKMDYAYDYTMDLVSAYRDAVRKGNLGLDGYRGALSGLGMVPERVEGYVFRERARLKPTEPLTPLAPVTPVYETDAGKVSADTARRKRRKLLITRDQEIATFVQLGMEPAYATALADNDDVRLAEKGGEGE